MSPIALTIIWVVWRLQWDFLLLGVVIPSFRPVYKCLSNESLNESKSYGDSLTCQGPVNFGITQNTAEIMWPAFSLFSHNIDDYLGGCYLLCFYSDI